MQMAVNISAALGAIIGNILLGRDMITPLVLTAACLYCLAAVVVAVTVPGGLRPGEEEKNKRKPLRLGLLKVVVQDRAVRQVSIVTAAGGFLYGQFFSAVALHVAELSRSSEVRSSVFVANAVTIVLVQAPVSAAVKARMGAGTGPQWLLALGVALFSVAFVVMGSGTDSLTILFVATLLFSLAETVFTPLVNTTFASVDQNRPLVELFNLRQVAITVGESLGSFSGGALYLTAVGQRATPLYWFALSAFGAIVAFPRLRVSSSLPIKEKE
jgi:MFS transporter, DHA1 family, multidrug resistance protein